MGNPTLGQVAPEDAVRFTRFAVCLSNPRRDLDEALEAAVAALYPGDAQDSLPESTVRRPGGSTLERTIVRIDPISMAMERESSFGIILGYVHTATCFK